MAKLIPNAQTACLGILMLIITSTATKAQSKNDAILERILSSIQNEQVKKIIAYPNQYRCQIIYTQIDRNAKGSPRFTHHRFNVDSNLYFNPASMVKMPLAFLSLEKLNELKINGVDKYTTMAFDSSHEKQVAMTTDSSAKNFKPSIAQFIRRAMLISENDPYNRMYQFVGQETANQKLIEKGYTSSRITRQFMGYTEEQNRHTNGVRFFNAEGKLVYQQLPAYNRDSFRFPSPILIGDKHINRNDELVNGPFDFTRHNNISLDDMRQMLQAVLYPLSVPKNQRFNLTEADRLFLLQYMSQYPAETPHPNYDSTIFYNSYVKFFFQDSTHRLPAHMRVFNKVGWAYGFLTDVSYVIDSKNNIDYMLSATVYVNSDGIINDSKYDEESMGFPFFRELGKAVYRYELQRPRMYKPSLKMNGVVYEKRDPQDKRPTIKMADN
jgi:hypothetical protein